MRFPSPALPYFHIWDWRTLKHQFSIVAYICPILPTPQNADYVMLLYCRVEHAFVVCSALGVKVCVKPLG